MEENRQYHPGLEVSPYQNTQSPAFDPNSVEHQSSGLEVVPEQYGLHPVEFPPQGEKTPQVANNVYQPYSPAPPYNGAGMEGIEVKPYDGYGQGMAGMPTPFEQQPQPVKNSRKKMWWIIGAAIVVAIIIAAVVGGVVGSRSSHANSNKNSSPSSSDNGDNSDGGGSSSGGSDNGTSSGNGTSSSNSTDTPDTSNALKNIRPLCNLAVTGYRDGDDFRVRLFYQGPEGNLRYSDYLSADDAWSNPLVLSNLNAINGTPVAAGTLLDLDPPQIHLFYLDDDSLLKGQLFQPGGNSARGDASGINPFRLKIDVSSRMAGYFPYVVAQDTDGTIRWVGWHGPNDWSNETFDGIKGTDGTGLAIVPAAVSYRDGGAFIYRNEDGEMSTFLASQNGDVPTTWAWAFGAELAAPIPKDSAIGAFVFAREADLVNTYALYQDDSGTLQYLWQNDTSSGWQGPATSDALSGADNGTDIACLTETAWDAVGVNITTATDMNRCYFQSEGKVKEVRFDGDNWLDLGFLPID